MIKITEQEFRLGSSCPSKIIHSRAGFARNDVDDSFAQWMRSEGTKFRALAKYLFPGAVEVSDPDAVSAGKKTNALVQSGKTVAGAKLCSDLAQTRIDMLQPHDSVLRLYSFVPKIVDLELHNRGLEFCGSSGWLRKEWYEHLESVAFRIAVVQQLFPQHRIVPLMVVPARKVPCEVEGLHRFWDEARSCWDFPQPEVLSSAFSLLHVVDVARECEPLKEKVRAKMFRLSAFIENPMKSEIGYRCKKCEFKVPGASSGFEKCWGLLASVKPPMFELAYMYFIQENGKPIADRLAREGRVSLWDIPKERITGDHALRQHMQLAGTEAGKEILLPELEDELKGIVYPLRCLDIETLRSLLPAHAGEQVNELVFFQFSVHKCEFPGEPLEHVGWLNGEKSHPNKRFLSALRAALGDAGTVCVWTKYEEDSFAELIHELVATGCGSEDMQWLRCFLSSGRILDLHGICFRCHFHPLMKGRTSIKAVLPALWSVNSPVKVMAPFSEFPSDTDPYASLKSENKISDGCMAMEGYLDVIGSDAAVSAASRASLERYCFVDTAAMFFVIFYWWWRLDGSPTDSAKSDANVNRA